MEFRKNTILSAAAALSRPARLLTCGFAYACLGILESLNGCSSAPIKMECQELQARIDYGNLTGDQLRFAQAELDECRGRVKSADRKDSAFIDGTEKRFSPSDSDAVPAGTP
jgi:hypothetical protein